MRQAIATILLICFGFLIPTAAAPIRVCFIEDKVLEPGFQSHGETADGKIKCCPDCGGGSEDGSCCLEVKKLPESLSAASTPVFIPLLFCVEFLPAVAPDCPVVEIAQVFVPATPIRGPDTPASRRAVLEIWNI